MSDKFYRWVDDDVLVVYGTQLVRLMPMKEIPLWRRLLIAVGYMEQPKYHESPQQVIKRTVRVPTQHRASKIILVYGDLHDEINAIVTKDRRENLTDGHWDSKKLIFTPREYL